MFIFWCFGIFKSTYRSLPDFIFYCVGYTLQLPNLYLLEGQHIYSYFEVENHFYQFHLLFLYTEDDIGVTEKSVIKYFLSGVSLTHLTLLPLEQL